MRRLLCVCLAILCLLTVFGCSETTNVSEPTSDDTAQPQSQDLPQTFAVAYSKEDTLHPYAATTEVNVNLSSLLYDSLTVIDDRFMPQNSLAASVEQIDATHLKVTLREGAVFSDGTAVTPKDVTASFDDARNSENYKTMLSNIASVSIDRRSDRLTFTLKKGDPNAAACLAFPVYKVSTDTKKAGEAPVGGGAYVYKTGKNGARLTANPERNEKPRYKTVPLRHLPNSDSMYYGLASGNITYYYNDLNTGEVPRVSGASAKVAMNALIYLGVNNDRSALKSASVRRALSLVLDRESLAYSGCAGWAQAATLPFHPNWESVSEIEPIFGKSDLAEATSLLEKADKKKWELELIYSIDNGNRGALADLVRTQLESLGARVTVTPLAYEEYLTRLQSGKYDLYIGEIRLTANMDLDVFFAAGEARYGIANNSSTAKEYQLYREGESSLKKVVQKFEKEMPYIPLCWRCGFAAYDRRLLAVTPHGYDPYYGFVNWH